MKGWSSILPWTFPERYVSIFCGVSGFVLLLAGVVGCFRGDGGDGLLFLLLGVVCFVGIRPRQAGRVGPSVKGRAAHGLEEGAVRPEP